MAKGNGRQMWIEAHLAVGRDPLDAAIGGDALLKAAVHQLGVVALLLHLRWGEGCGAGAGAEAGAGAGPGFRGSS